MQKSKLSIGLLIMAIVMVTGTSFASGGPPPVPDGGSSALLVVISMSALALGRKLLR